MAAPSITFAPEPNEVEYYDALFAIADVKKTGNIGGAEAVQFFQRSKLPVDALKMVWTVADTPVTNALDKRKFAIAVRFIQLMQNGVRGEGPNLAAPAGTTLRPPTFEGISGVVVPFPGQGPPPPTATETPPATPARPPMAPGSANRAQPPNVLSRPPMPPSTASVGSLTTQDPYSMPPSEQARYEALFPQYAKDGYVLAPDAVKLFSQSGLDNASLGAIWSMSDSPPDSKLDKVEFAIAMHLIVCISKRNLPLPAALPASLLQLKSQQAHEPAPTVPPVSVSIPGPQRSSSPAMSAMTQTAYAPPAQAATADMAPPPAMSSLSGPPPLEKPAGGLSISDAFEGLDQGGSNHSTGLGSVASVGSYNQGPAVGSYNQSPSMGSVHQSPSLAPEPEPLPAPAVKLSMMPPAPAPQVQEPEPEPEPKSTEQLASNYSMGAPLDELEKLKGAMVRLQAENISLKAQLGSMTDEEKDVQKQLAATVAEITALTGELTTLRADVSSAKERLMDLNSQLKGASEKKGALKDLIAETTATKEAIEDATEALQAAQESAAAAPPVPAPAPASIDLFSFDSPPQAMSQAPVDDVAAPSHDESAPAVEQPPAPIPAPAYDDGPSIPEPAPSYESSMPSPSQYQFMQNAQPPLGNSSSFDYAQPSSFDYSQPSAPEGAGLYMSQMPPPVTNDYGGHQRNDSTLSAFNEVMGGAAAPVPSYLEPIAASPVKSKADDVAKKVAAAESALAEAKETEEKTKAFAEDLRKIADEAETAARTYNEKPKKKGAFGRGKKKDAKEAENLAIDARKKKEAFVLVQSQIHDAEAAVVHAQRTLEQAQVELQEAASAAPPQQANGYDQQPAQWGDYTQQSYGNGAPQPYAFAGY